MAGDWIKMDHATPDKPEVWRMSALLRISPEAVVGHLVRVWVWADQQSVNVDQAPDAFVDVELSTLDAVAHLQGFGEAMLAVKWLHVEGGRIVFPSLQSYISESAKIRALKNRAQGKWRATKVASREEKNSPLPPKGGRAKSARKSKANPKNNGANRVPLSEDAITALGMRYNMPAHAGESRAAYRARVLAEDRRQHGEEHDK